MTSWENLDRFRNPVDLDDNFECFNEWIIRRNAGLGANKKERAVRLTEHQYYGLRALAVPGASFMWSNYPKVKTPDGTHIARLHANTAISFRWHDFAAKSAETGRYIITAAGLAALANEEARRQRASETKGGTAG